MIRHQTVSEHPPAAVPHDAVAQNEELLPIVIVVVDRLAAIAARRDVVRASGDLFAVGPGHAEQGTTSQLPRPPSGQFRDSLGANPRPCLVPGTGQVLDGLGCFGLVAPVFSQNH
jgi:hypothetical protein